MFNYYACMLYYTLLGGDFESGALGLFMTYSVVAHAGMELDSMIGYFCPILWF